MSKGIEFFHSQATDLISTMQLVFHVQQYDPIGLNNPSMESPLDHLRAHPIFQKQLKFTFYLNPSHISHSTLTTLQLQFLGITMPSQSIPIFSHSAVFVAERDPKDILNNNKNRMNLTPFLCHHSLRHVDVTTDPKMSLQRG